MKLVRIGLTISAFNDLDILACGIQNTYLTRDFREWVWVQGWKEHAGDKGPIWIEEIWCSIQGLPSVDSGCNGL